MTSKKNFVIILLIINSLMSYTAGFPLKPVAKNNVVADQNVLKTPTLEIQKPTVDELSHYNMNATFFKGNASLNNEMNFSYLNTEDTALNYLYFNLWPNFIESNSLTIQNIAHDAQSLDYSLTGTNGSYLLVNLTQFVDSGSRYNIQINFSLKLPYMQERFGYQLQQNGSIHDIYALTNWYPILAVYEYGHFVLQPYTPNGESFYSDMAYYNVSLTADKSLIVASGGQLNSFTFDMTHQYNSFSFFPAREISFIMSPDFISAGKQAGNSTVYSYYFPEDSTIGLKCLDSAVSAINLFSNLYGPYPYSYMSVVDFNFGWLGMEYSGLVLIDHSAYNQISESTYIYNLEYVLVNLIAHQWTTYVVANNPYIDPWLDEAFGIYSYLLYLEFHWGAVYAEQEILTFKDMICLNSSINYPIGNGMSFWDTNDNTVNQSYAYFHNMVFKGCIFFDFLRAYLGNDTFFSFVSQYFTNFSYKTVKSNEFLNLLNAVSGQNLTWIFSFFIYNSVYFNSFSIDKTTIIFEANTITNMKNFNFTLKQFSNNSVSVKIPLLLTFTEGTEYIWAWLNGTSSVVCVSVNNNLGNLTKVTIDPNRIYFRDSAIINVPITFIPKNSTTITTKDPIPIPNITTKDMTTTNTSSTITPGFNLLIILSFAIISIVIRKKAHKK